MDNVVAGARVILRQALDEIDIQPERGAKIEEMLELAKRHEAPVDKMAQRWQMIAMGKPGLTRTSRALMMEQAARVWYWYYFGLKDGL